MKSLLFRNLELSTQTTKKSTMFFFRCRRGTGTCQSTETIQSKYSSKIIVDPQRKIARQKAVFGYSPIRISNNGIPKLTVVK